MKKTVLVLVTCAIPVLLALAALPLFFSSDLFLKNVLERVNQHPGQHLQIGGLDIGWSSGLCCDQVEYVDDDHGLRVTVERIEGKRGLLALLVAPKNPGSFTFHHPVVTIHAGAGPPPGGSGKGKQGASGRSADRKDPGQGGQVAADSVATEPALWEELTIQMEIRDGEVVLKNRPGQPSVPPGRVNLLTSLANGTLQYNLTWLSADQGRLDAQGYINLPADKAHFLETLVLKSHLQVKRFQLAPLFALAAVRSQSIPEGQGVLDGEMTITGAGRARLDLLGRLECTDLALSGGMLGQDHPHIARLAVGIDGGKKEDRRYHISDVHLEGDFGHMRARADYGQGRGTIHTDGTLYLPFFTRQLPHLLHIGKNASLSTGELTFSGDMSLDRKQAKIQIQASADHLAGRVQGKPFSWGRAARLSLTGHGNKQDFSVESLDIHTSFASLSGKGTNAHCVLQGQVDMAKAEKQLGALFDLPWHGRGSLATQIAFTQTRDKNKKQQIVFSLQSQQCAVSYKGKTVLPSAPLNVTGEAVLSRGWKGPGDPFDFHLAWRGWPGEFSVDGRKLQLTPENKRGEFSIGSDFDLGSVVRVLRAVDAIPVTVDGQGQVRANIVGSLAGNMLRLADPQCIAEDLNLSWPGHRLREARLILQGRGKPGPGQGPIAVHGLQVAKNRTSWSPRQGGRIVVDLGKRSFELHELSVTGRLADIDIDQLVVDDPAKLPVAWHGAIRGRFDLARLTALLASPEQKEAASRLRPAGQLTCSLQGNQESKPYGLNLRCLAKELQLKRAGEIVFADPALSLNLDINGLFNGEKVRIKVLDLASTPLDMKATGSLATGPEGELRLQGEHRIRFASLAGILRGITGKELKIEGQHKEKFSLVWPLHGSWKKQGQMTTRMLVDMFSFAGMEAESVAIPVQLENGTLTTGAEGQLNRGKLSMKMALETGASPPVLTMPTEQKVLSDVQIDKPLAEGLLSRLHPLFGILARPSGQVSVKVASLAWPLPAAYRNDARFKVIFDTSRIDLVSRGVMREVLELLSVREQQLYLKQSQVTCTCKQGRVSCSPVKILLADSEMTISGSVGLDKSLDYLLEIPLTEKLIGREGARILEGTVVQVPIRGTLDKPQFDRSIITDALANLAGQAAKKAIQKEVEKLVPGLFKGLKF